MFLHRDMEVFLHAFNQLSIYRGVVFLKLCSLLFLQLHRLKRFILSINEGLYKFFLCIFEYLDLEAVTRLTDIVDFIYNNASLLFGFQY